MLTLNQIEKILEQKEKLSNNSLKTINLLYLQKLAQSDSIPNLDITDSILGNFEPCQDITKNPAYDKNGKYQGVGSAPNSYKTGQVIGINKNTGNPKPLSELQIQIYEELRENGRNHLDSLIICRFNTPKAFVDYIKFKTNKTISKEIANRLHRNNIPLERILEWYTM